MAVSFGIGSYIEGGVISAVVALNVVVGFFQEFSAEKTMNSLRSLSSPTASVIRDGQTIVIPTGEIAFGDLVEIKVGDTVPADIRYVFFNSIFHVTIIILTRIKTCRGYEPRNR